MLPSKIKLSDNMISKMKAARVSKRLPAATLSKAIQRDASYISSLELGRLRSISSYDLVAIFGTIFEIPEYEAIAKAEEFISPEKQDGSGGDCSLSNGETSGTGSGFGAMMVGEPTKKYAAYDMLTGYAEAELISDMLETICNLLIEFCKRDPKEAVFALQSLIKTMQFDPDFTMGVMGIPFYALKTLSIEERKAALDELLEVFKKYAAKEN